MPEEVLRQWRSTRVSSADEQDLAARHAFQRPLSERPDAPQRPSVGAHLHNRRGASQAGRPLIKRVLDRDAPPAFLAGHVVEYSIEIVNDSDQLWVGDLVDPIPPELVFDPLTGRGRSAIPPSRISARRRRPSPRSEDR